MSGVLPLVLALPLALGGCGSLQSYPGPPRHAAEVAVVVPSLQFGQSTRILAVNGDELGPWRDRVELLPGSHELVVTTRVRVRERVARHTRTLRLLARAGARYVICGRHDPLGTHLEIIEQR